MARHELRQVVPGLRAIAEARQGHVQAELAALDFDAAVARQAGAVPYRKLLDASRAECHLMADEVAELAAHAKSLKGESSPMAIFTGSSGNDDFVTIVSTMLRLGRRLRTFSTIHATRRWLDRAPAGRSS